MCSQNQVREVDYYYTLLLESLKAVKMKLISYDKENNKDIYVNERAFAYELYRQFANRLYDDIGCVEKWAKERPSVVINAELYKCVGKNNKEDDKGRKFPDIVIHGGQHDKGKQYIVCEIKVNASESEIENDIGKLFDYMDDNMMFEHEYKLGVFINVGPKNTFEKNLYNYFIKSNKRKGHLICISYDEGHVEVIGKGNNI